MRVKGLFLFVFRSRWSGVLSMLLTVPSEPYGVSGAVVEAAQTQGALCFCPLGVSVVHGNGFGGAVEGALSATYASVGKVEGRGGAMVLI